jgi:hypothetical protein
MHGADPRLGVPHDLIGEEAAIRVAEQQAGK